MPSLSCQNRRSKWLNFLLSFTYCNLISLSIRKLILPSCWLLPTTTLKIIDTTCAVQPTQQTRDQTWPELSSFPKAAESRQIPPGFWLVETVLPSTIGYRLPPSSPQKSTPFFLSTNQEEILIYQPLLWGVSSTGAELFSDISRHNAANDFFPLVFKTINPTLIWKLNRILRSFGIGTGGGSKSPPLNVVVSHMKHCWLWLVVVSHHQMIFGGFKDTDCCL